MKLLTDKALLQCAHITGIIHPTAGQSLVRIGGSTVLVEPDPVAVSIAGCPIAPPAGKPCTSTLAVQKGYSGILRINGHRVCLDTVTGFTDGVPPGTVKYNVRNPGQGFVDEL